MSTIEIDPKQFIITRKRKKYKFALFANSPLCYELDDWEKQTVDTIELGAGTGLFSVELASRHPERTYVAIDVKADRLQKGAQEAAERGLTNIRFVRARADQLEEIVPPESLGSLWVTFPDPFPRERSSGRRLTHAHYLAIYRRLLKTDGAFYLKHDNRQFFDWSIEQLLAEKWRIVEQTNDLHATEFDDEYKIMTTYEKRWLGEGLATNFLKAVK